MKVDTHSLLLDAALFGSPALACRSPQRETAALPPDEPTAASWESASAKAEGAEPPAPTWPAE
jgi:hypothetical protein